MDKIVKAMMNLIGFETLGGSVCLETFADFINTDYIALYKLSKKHDLAHLVGDALIKNNLIADEKIKSAFQKELFTAVYRYESINFELDNIKSIFNENEIEFIPLKGAVIRNYYPEAWMRTSCDIDILVHEADVDRAADCLVEKGFSKGKKLYHDISLYSPGGKVHLELHFSLKETKDSTGKLLLKAWEYAYKRDENSFEYLFTNEFFIYHQLAHISYHFSGGGCGVRPFIDVLLLEKQLNYDKTKLDELLTEGKIKTFSDAFYHLSRVWFTEEDYSEITKKMETFLLSGGVYGNMENRISSELSRNNGKASNIFRRIWLPYTSLVILYPSLKGKRILQPFYEIKRWFKLFKKGVLKKSVKELKANVSMSQEKVDETKTMLKELGLTD